MSGGNAGGWLNALYPGAPWLTNRDAVIGARHLAKSYGAIAYSRSTGRYGWSYSADSREAAENSALRHCQAADAAIVVPDRHPPGQPRSQLRR